MPPSDSKPRILMVIGLFYPTLGGAENQAKRLSEELARRGHEVSVLTLAHKGAPATERIGDVEVHRAIRGFPLGPIWRVVYTRSTLAALRRLAPTYDIIHCHQLYLHAVAAVKIARELGKKAICKVVCGGEYSDFLRLKKFRGGPRLVETCKGLDRIVALTDAIREEARAEGFGDDRIVTIPNMVDTDAFSPPSGPRSASELLYLGRLHPQKNLGILLKAFAELSARRPELSLSIVGDGPQRAELTALVGRLGLNEKVRFEGEQRDVLPYLRRAALVVTATGSEGLSNLLLEAMACGAPILASDIAPNLEVVGRGETDLGGFSIGAGGASARTGDPQAFAAGAEYLMARPELRTELGERARRTALERFSVDRVAAQYAQLYEELLAPNAAVR